MATSNYTITFTPAIGNYGTLIEYREIGSSTWITPSSPPNPTTLTSYDLELEIGKAYIVRLSSNGINCTKKYVYTSIPIGGCCPVGYTLSEDGTYCYLDETTAATPPSASETAVTVTNAFFTRCGTMVLDPGYTLNGNGSFQNIGYDVNFWNNNGGTGDQCNNGNLVDGPMNRNAVWATTTLDNQTVGFTFCIDVPETKTYYIGVGFDNYGQISIDGNVILLIDNDSPNPLENWLIFPVELLAGSHVIEVIGINGVSTPPNPGAIAVEIYNNTRDEILESTSYGDLDVLFQTADYVGEDIQIGSDGIGYTCPDGYSLVLCDGPAYCTKRTIVAPEAC